MQYVLYIFALGVCAFASLVLYVAWNQTHSAIHEIAAFILYGVGAIFLVGGAVVGSLTRAARKQEPPRRSPARQRSRSISRREQDAIDALDQMNVD